MATHDRWKSCSVTWFGREVEGRVERMIIGRLHKAGNHLVARMRKNIGQPAGDGRGSRPGGFPMLRTGRLANSLFYVVDEGTLTLHVGTDEPYGLMLEYGTSGGRVIVAPAGKVFSWIDPATGERVFARTVRLGSIRRRSFIRRTMFEEAKAVTRILTSGPAGGRVRAGEDRQAGGGRGGYVAVGDR